MRKLKLTRRTETATEMAKSLRAFITEYKGYMFAHRQLTLKKPAFLDNVNFITLPNCKIVVPLFKYFFCSQIVCKVEMET